MQMYDKFELFFTTMTLLSISIRNVRMTKAQLTTTSNKMQLKQFISLHCSGMLYSMSVARNYVIFAWKNHREFFISLYHVFIYWKIWLTGDIKATELLNVMKANILYIYISAWILEAVYTYSYTCPERMTQNTHATAACPAGSIAPPPPPSR